MAHVGIILPDSLLRTSKFLTQTFPGLRFRVKGLMNV